MADDPLRTISQVTPRRPARKATPAVIRTIHPPDLPWELTVQKGRVVIGRIASDEATPPLSHETVSRSHFSVHWDRILGAHIGTDLGSHNGTRINGVSAHSRGHQLEDCTVIQLGDVFAIYEKNRGLSAPDVPEVSKENIPGDCAAIRLVRASVAKAAPDPSPVLLIGETGTGKEWIAKELHRLSGREGPLVAINCSALSPQIIDSQLFGHVRGAFTGATADQQGLFRAADCGTLFLDEIGEMPLELQPKLLRVLQDGLVSPVGSTKTMSVDVRVLAATNRDLTSAIDEGTFRRDLYARLALWEIAIPPLRARRGDIMMWINRLHDCWVEQRTDKARYALDFLPDAVESIVLHDWPDNLRGLDRLIHEISTRSTTNPGVVAHDDLPGWLLEAAAPSSVDMKSPDTKDKAPAPAPAKRSPVPTREEFEKVFEDLDGNVRAMAKHFGRDRRQIYRWLETFGLATRRKRKQQEH
jgi:transcriptional regulator with GAF, ATPase, and Fis domain